MNISSAHWIGRGDVNMVDWRRPAIPSPCFRRDFTLEEKPERAVAEVAGLGFFNLYINGKKVSDHVLQTAPSAYDRVWRFRRFDVGQFLQKGKNIVGVELGNGFYNCISKEVWHFDKAAWRDYPKMAFVLLADDKLLLSSDTEWCVLPGALIYDSLYSGEIYDARRESDWLSPKLEPLKNAKIHDLSGVWPLPDDGMEQQWSRAFIVPPPGGIPEEELAPPCRISQTFPMSPLAANRRIYQSPYNISGWARLRVSGKSGSKVIMRFSEKLSDDGQSLDTSGIDNLLLDGPFQQDVYILNGSGVEEWEPRFTYHGFRYVQVDIEGEATVESLDARFVHTDFAVHGQFSSTDETLNMLMQMGERAYLSNFVGIPTDCPQREKNGWTSEAQLALEYGLYRFDSAQGYREFENTFASLQRPSGQFPGIIPSAGWGYNWGSGPAWDSAFFTIAWQLYLFTGDIRILERHFDSMLRYLDFCDHMQQGRIIRHGLGDWLTTAENAPPSFMISTAFYFYCADIAARCALILGRSTEHHACRQLADEIRTVYNQSFYSGSGHYDGDSSTLQALPLCFGITPDKEKTAVAQILAQKIRAGNGKTNYGTIGSKAVPRALFENGFADEAFQLITQKEYPGYAYWFETLRLDTFCECWDGSMSRNHSAFCDILACSFRYLAGFRHDEKSPGSNHLIIQPIPPARLAGQSCSYLGFYSHWQKNINQTHFQIRIPPNATATILLPHTTPQFTTAGSYDFFIKNQ